MSWRARFSSSQSGHRTSSSQPIEDRSADPAEEEGLDHELAQDTTQPKPIGSPSFLHDANADDLLAPGLAIRFALPLHQEWGVEEPDERRRRGRTAAGKLGVRGADRSRRNGERGDRGARRRARPGARRRREPTSRRAVWPAHVPCRPLPLREIAEAGTAVAGTASPAAARSPAAPDWGPAPQAVEAAAAEAGATTWVAAGPEAWGVAIRLGVSRLRSRCFFRPEATTIPSLFSGLRGKEPIERGQVRPRGRGRLRDRNRRAGQGGRRPPLPRRRHRGPRRARSVREGLGPPGGRPLRARAPAGRAASARDSLRGLARRPAVGARDARRPSGGCSSCSTSPTTRRARTSRARRSWRSRSSPSPPAARACRLSRRPRSTRRSSIPERFLVRWRGEADPGHVKAIDAYWISAAEHGMNASTFTARVVASTGADVRRMPVGRRRRPLGAAPRRRPVARARDARRRRRARVTPRST